MYNKYLFLFCKWGELRLTFPRPHSLHYKELELAPQNYAGDFDTCMSWKKAQQIVCLPRHREQYPAGRFTWARGRRVVIIINRIDSRGFLNGAVVKVHVLIRCQLCSLRRRKTSNSGQPGQRRCCFVYCSVLHMLHWRPKLLTLCSESSCLATPHAGHLSNL